MSTIIDPFQWISRVSLDQSVGSGDLILVEPGTGVYAFDAGTGNSTRLGTHLAFSTRDVVEHDGKLYLLIGDSNSSIVYVWNGSDFVLNDNNPSWGDNGQAKNNKHFLSHANGLYATSNSGVRLWDGVAWVHVHDAITSLADQGLVQVGADLIWMASGFMLRSIGGIFTTEYSLQNNSISSSRIEHEESGGVLYILGIFNSIQDLRQSPTPTVVRRDFVAISAFGPPDSTWADGFEERAGLTDPGDEDFFVSADNSILVGASAVSANRVALWNGTAWSALADGGNLVVQPQILDHGGTTYYVGSNHSTLSGSLFTHNGTVFESPQTGVTDALNPSKTFVSPSIAYSAFGSYP